MFDKSQIIYGDCFDIMQQLSKGQFSLCITSPPYNANKEYESKLSIDEYKNFAEKWVSYLPGLLSDNGQFWLNVGYTKIKSNCTLPLTYLYYPLVDMEFIQEIVWYYKAGMSYKKRFSHRTERWMWFAKDTNNLTFNLDDIRDISLNESSDKRNNPLGKNPTDLWTFNRVVGGNGKTDEKTSHPCQFPIAMIKRIILACTNPGDWILDPFSGSGTVAVAAKELGRNFICIESNSKYIEDSVKRLSRSSGDIA